MKETKQKRLRALGLPLTLIALLLAFTASAQAAYDPIGGGTTKLSLDKGLLSFLKKQGVTLTAKAPAKRQGSTLVLPVSGGKEDPTTGKGEVTHEGTIVFAKGKRKVPLRSIELKAKKTPLFAKVGGSQLKLVSAKRIVSTREGFGQGFKATGLGLTAKVATRLNKKLRTGKAFEEGLAIGTLKSKTQPQRVAILDQGQGMIVPDPQILAKFKSLFVSLNPIAPAELAPGPLLKFPVALGGQISPDASEGSLRLGGAIELLQLGAGQVFHSEYWLDLGAKSTSAEVDIEPTPAFPGKLGRLGAFDLGVGAVSSEPKTRTITLTGAPLTLTAATAQSFNEAFAGGKAVFGAGETFGVVGFGAVGQ
ncbi:MAG TPA: hypothetical protein VFS48_08060 [Solirubrobacterales bacterium]|nr:hypothetical protein [Solirubrobacterales bacterium]